MEDLAQVYKKTSSLHHAYVIEGNQKKDFAGLLSFLEKSVGFKTHGNLDFYHESFDSFGIDEARRIKEMQQKKPFIEGGKKVFILSFNFITREAQNSLLKVFEEPTSGTHFFLLVPSAEIFLPTVRSRVVILSQKYSVEGRHGSEGGSGSREIAYGNFPADFCKNFLKSSPKVRLEMFAEIIEEKDKARVISFLNNLESLLFQKWNKNLSVEKTTDKAEIFKQIITCRNYLHDRAPSVKMILEHITLVTPVVIS